MSHGPRRARCQSIDLIARLTVMATALVDDEGSPTCGICCETYEQNRLPKFLTCYHTFCTQCLAVSDATILRLKISFVNGQGPPFFTVIFHAFLNLLTNSQKFRTCYRCKCFSFTGPYVDQFFRVVFVGTSDRTNCIERH